MSDLEGIRQRRSIRKYKPDPVPREAIEEVLGAAILAPSGKNRQPWKFLVYQGAAKAALLDEMEKGIARETGENAALPGLASGLVYAGATLRTMRAAPVVILVLNTNAASPCEAGPPESRFMAMYDDLAVGAAMQNLLIRAAELAHRLILRRARLDLVDDGADLFEFLIVAGAEQARKKSHNCMIRLSKRPAAGRRCTRCDSAPGGAKRPGRARPALSRKGRAGRC